MSNWSASMFQCRSILDWLKEYIAESRRLTTISLETLLGAREYRAHVQQVASALFDTLSHTQSSADDVSRSAMTLFNQLVVSSYRRFMTYDERVPLDEKFQKCLVNKALDIEAFPSQRELLYTLTSGSSLIETLRTMLIYMDADIQRLKSIATSTSNACTQRYARETLCPICVNPSSSVDPISQATGVNESLCPNACRQVIRTCFNQTSNPYVAFASIAKGYSIVAKDIERAVVQLQVKLVELTRGDSCLLLFPARWTSLEVAHLLLWHGCQREQYSAHLHWTSNDLSTRQWQTFHTDRVSSSDHQWTTRTGLALESIVAVHSLSVAIVDRPSRSPTDTTDQHGYLFQC